MRVIKTQSHKLKLGADETIKLVTMMIERNTRQACQLVEKLITEAYEMGREGKKDGRS